MTSTFVTNVFMLNAGSNYTKISTAASSNLEVVLPATNGATGECLQINGASQTMWTATAATGPPGPSGKGEIGTTGHTGSVGPTGAVGATGQQGPPGAASITYFIAMRAAVLTSTLRFFTIAGTLATTFDEKAIVLPKNGTLKNLRAMLPYTWAVNIIVAIYVNGAATSIGVTITSGNTTSSDLTHTVAVSAGDKFSFAARTTAFNMAGGVYCSIEY